MTTDPHPAPRTPGPAPVPPAVPPPVPVAATSGLPPALASAYRLVRDLVAGGVQDVVLAPGSRSAPLAYAVADAADAGLLSLHVRVDERSAAFLALGLARGAAAGEAGAGPAAEPEGSSRTARAAAPRPVAVVTTSGTAAANLHPAVLEAHHSDVPLVVLTADRPHELRGTGANQTTDQVDLFGGAVRLAVDVPAPTGRPGELRDVRALATRALAAATGARTGHGGPVHLNLAFREPLAPEPGAARAGAATGTDSASTADARSAAAGAPPVVALGARAGSPAGAVADVPDDAGPRAVVGHVAGSLAPGGAADLADDVPRTVLVAGDGAGRVARDLAEARGWPLLAEASSGAAGGPCLVRAHRLVLGVDRLGGEVRRVVVLGRPTLSRPVQRLLADPDVEVVVVAPGSGPWPDAARNAAVVLPGVPDRWWDPSPGTGTGAFPGARARWLAAWQAASTAAARVVEDEVDGPPTGLSVAAAVAGACAPSDVLVVGSSNPVRDLDLVAGWDEPVHVVANRGVAGIDGTVSTALGVATVASRAGRRTHALVGDLTFLHDVGGLLRGPHEEHVDLQVVVVNDDGGSIFAGLEHGALAETSAASHRTFERVFATPHGANLAQLCAGYGVDHQLVTDVPSLRHALAAPSHGVQVIEVPVPRADRRAAGAALAARVREAVVAALPAPGEG